MNATLLQKGDPSPVDLLNPDSDHPLLLVCEHAGQAVPQALHGLGLKGAEIQSHVGWDIGAEAVTRKMARALGAPAVIQRYSRLVIDCNRPPDAADAMPAHNHGITVPGNQNLDAADRKARVDEVFTPFHTTVDTLFDRQPRRIVLSIHSFTPSLAGVQRPWDVGFLFRKDTGTSTRLSQFIAATKPDLTIGMNQPYQIEDASDWFVPQHGEARNLPHSLIEIRNDLIRDDNGQSTWADMLVSAVNQYLKDTA
ncbi:N-formylglutamate amidohydrolase [Phaeobacter inhibens]|uniref:N-formylglutamate amidohydrolase n=1 Tax=Phaeobacter inhibens TaxID=221822 RepID=UPI0021A7619E|nr:N-formylglutamate amidohydrolase [Phaeobacter inhibens]UWR48592.1 N-formylglutamate amidohydrolase [Phaeobacter inhibens]UWR60178.1 N-formylglutamate amidohydrolase [Phaeobacter inhibens]